MPDCHKCPVSKEIAEGKHNRTPWNKMPCATCKMSEYISHGGQSYVSIDASRANCDGDTMGESYATLHDARGPRSFHPVDVLEPEEHTQTADEAEELAIWMASEILYRFSRMNPAKRERVFAAFTMPGESGAEVSRGMGITPQALSACFKEVVKEFPELKPCLPVKQQAKKPAKEIEDDLQTVDRPPPPPDYDAGGFED